MTTIPRVRYNTQVDPTVTWDPSARGTTSGTNSNQSTAVTAPPADTVHLSTNAQIRSLKQSGASVQQIATSLGLSAAEVDQELGISSSSNSVKANEVAVLLS